MKTVVVIGGSRGIGAETVKLLANSGYKVAFSYNKSEDEALLLANTSGAFPFKADVKNKKELFSGIEEVKRKFGKISALVVSSGIAYPEQLFCDTSDDMLQEIMNVNVVGTMNSVKAVLPGMISEGYGKIVLLSSIWGIDGGSCEVLYSATKGAICGFCRALAREVGLSGVTVNAVAPGLIDTEMNSMLSVDDKKEFCEGVSLGREGKPSEVATVIKFLISDDSSYINGQIIRVDGGM